MDKFNLAEISKKLAATKQELLIQLSVQAQNYFAKSFKNQGFDGNQWEEVKRRKPEENAYKYPKGKGLQRRTQPILTGAGYKQRGGALRKAVATMSTTAVFRGNQIVMNVNLPYAKIHNEGLQGKAFGKYPFTMPKRKFVGQTNELTEMQRKKITKVVDQIWGTK